MHSTLDMQETAKFDPAKAVQTPATQARRRSGSTVMPSRRGVRPYEARRQEPAGAGAERAGRDDLHAAGRPAHRRHQAARRQRRRPGTNASSWFAASWVLGYTMLAGAINVVLITALATVGAVIYSLVTHLAGGIGVVLKETG